MKRLCLVTNRRRFLLITVSPKRLNSFERLGVHHRPARMFVLCLTVCLSSFVSPFFSGICFYDFLIFDILFCGEKKNNFHKFEGKHPGSVALKFKKKMQGKSAHICHSEYIPPRESPRCILKYRIMSGVVMIRNTFKHTDILLYCLHIRYPLWCHTLRGCVVLK